jgi:hypothetical protein
MTKDNATRFQNRFDVNLALRKSASACNAFVRWRQRPISVEQGRQKKPGAIPFLSFERDDATASKSAV